MKRKAWEIWTLQYVKKQEYLASIVIKFLYKLISKFVEHVEEHIASFSYVI